jgi:hypothetical protein
LTCFGRFDFERLSSSYPHDSAPFCLGCRGTYANCLAMKSTGFEVVATLFRRFEYQGNTQTRVPVSIESPDREPGWE